MRLNNFLLITTIILTGKEFTDTKMTVSGLLYSVLLCMK